MNPPSKPPKLYCPVCSTEPIVVHVDGSECECPNKDCPLYFLRLDSNLFRYGEFKAELEKKDRMIERLVSKLETIKELEGSE